MNVHSDNDRDLEAQREKIIGLGELSIRKSYYPELQQRQEALRESEAMLQVILHASPVMQFVIDRHHRVISWNKAMETYSGILATDIIGTDGQWRAFYPEKRPILADIVMDGPADLLEELYSGKYSKSRIVEDGYEVTDFFPSMGVSGKWLHATALPIKDIKGNVIGSIETVEDITERKKAEDALKESEKFLNNVIENIPNMIFVKDARNLHYVRLNRAGENLIGYKREELYGKGVYDFFPKAEADIISKYDQDAMEQNVVMDIPEEKIRTRYRGERVLHTKIISIYDEEGARRFLLGISDDITEHRRIENALQLARNKINLLNSVTFQDIQNAAFSLFAYHELMKTFVTDEKGKSFLEKQEQFNKKILDSLDFAKNYQNLGVKPPRWQNVERTFLLAISHLNFLNIERNLDLKGLEVYADPLLETVLYHIMKNSLVHGARVTKVNLWYEKKSDHLILYIEDNGLGIPVEEKNMIFDRGYGKDSGLGLFLVREVLSITNITIKETGEPGKGARFEITVPHGGYRIESASS